MPLSFCTFCARPIDPDRAATYRRIRGWEKRRSGGGANAITLREETGEYAHTSCITLELSQKRQHIHAGQLRFEALR